MFNKKAQAGIITVVLIILLVLAAIVIVWQVVNTTVTKGGSQVTAQSQCSAISLSVTKVSSTKYSVQRTGGGTIAITPNVPTVNLIVDGAVATCTWTPSVAGQWAQDGFSALCTLGSAATTTTPISAELILADGTACQSSTTATP